MAKKEWYDYTEARVILGLGEKAFKGARARGEIRTIGRRISGAEIERILGHPISDDGEQPVTATQRNNNLTPEVIEAQTKLQLEMVKRGYERMNDIDRRVAEIVKKEQEVEKIYREANKAKLDANEKVSQANIQFKEVNYGVREAQKHLESIQTEIDAKLQDAENKSNAMIKSAQDREYESNIMVEEQRAEVNSQLDEVLVFRKRIEEKAQAIVDYKDYHYKTELWVKMWEQYRQVINDICGNIAGLLKNRGQYIPKDFDKLLGSYLEFYQHQIAMIQVKMLEQPDEQTLTNYYKIMQEVKKNG